MRLAVFASGNGSNFEALAEAVEMGLVPASICCLIYDKADAKVKERAKSFHVPAYFFDIKDYSDKEAYEKAIVTRLKYYEIDIIILAGYMRLIGKTLLKAFPNKILNIHPSLLPKFPGKQGILDAFEAGEKETGVTVHLVDAGMDTGPILEQVRIPIDSKDSLETLEEKIHGAEHRLYPKVIKDFIEKLQK